MIGSRRRVASLKSQILGEGYSKERLDRLHSPIGLDIGAETPEEIAVSVLAEIIQARRKGSGANSDPFEALLRAFPPDREIAELLSDGDWHQSALVTVIGARGSTPRKAGARMIALSDGRSFGTVGGGCAESDVAGDSRKAVRDGQWLVRESDLTDEVDEDGMACGGKMQMLVEPLGLSSGQQ
jgi:xanthine dehydrogenase accessory factor